MFSNDQNIETLGQLIEVLRHYVGLQKEYTKLDIVDKVVRILTASAVFLVVSLLVILMLIYLSFAAAYALVPHFGEVSAFLIVASVYVVLLILICAFRHRLIERPLVKFLASLLLEK